MLSHSESLKAQFDIAQSNFKAEHTATDTTGKEILFKITNM